jgi:hypothetical protein
MINPPELPVTQNRSWWVRYWKWIATACSLAFIGAVVAFIFGIMSLIRSSDAYQGAMERVHSSAEVNQYLGTPIEDSLFVTGSLKRGINDSRADLIIPISGPKGQGIVCVEAVFIEQRWRFIVCQVQVNSDSHRIDLSDQSLPSKATQTQKLTPTK